MYLGQTKMTRDTKIKQKKDFLLFVKVLSQENYWMVQNVKLCWMQVPQSPTCQSLTICNAKLYMHYQNFLLTCKKIQVGNGQYVSVLFVISVIIDIHRHRFEIFTLVSEIHDNVDLVMGMKNIFELEGVIDS